MIYIMQADAAFVPLDPFYHPVRLTTASVVVASPSTYAIFADTHIEHLVELSSSTVAKLAPPKSSDLHRQRVKPDNAVYAIFTSGSADLPKGVVIDHQALATAAEAFEQSLDL